MNKSRKTSRDEENEILENYTGASSSGDCTGLIPAGGDHSADEFDNYKDICPFAVPKKVAEYKNEEAERLNRR